VLPITKKGFGAPLSSSTLSELISSVANVRIIKINICFIKGKIGH
jgi:hypothetical protein